MPAECSYPSLAWWERGPNLGKWDRVGSCVVRKGLWLVPGTLSLEDPVSPRGSYGL